MQQAERWHLSSLQRLDLVQLMGQNRGISQHLMLWLWPAGVIQGILESLTDAKGMWERLPPTLCFPLLSRDGCGLLGERSSSRDIGKLSGGPCPARRCCSTSSPRARCQPAHMEVFCCRNESRLGALAGASSTQECTHPEGKGAKRGAGSPRGLAVLQDAGYH